MQKLSFTIGLSILLAFVLFLFVAPTVLVFSTGTISSPASLSNSKIVNVNTTSADYLIETKAFGEISAKLKTTFAIPEVTCITSGTKIGIIIAIGHYSALDSGMELYASCSGSLSTYSIYYELAGEQGSISKPLSPGDQIQFVGTLNAKTGAVTYQISDLTHIWSSKGSGTEGISSVDSTLVDMGLVGSIPLPGFQATNIGANFTIGSHTGSIGSFLSVSSDFINKDTYVNSADGHILATASTITKSSTSFTISWVQSS